MTRCTFSPRAVRNLARIQGYISQDKPRAALEFAEKIEERCRELANAPQSGRPLPSFRRNLYSIPFRTYVIVYRILDSQIEIVDIFHGMRLKASGLVPPPSPMK